MDDISVFMDKAVIPTDKDLDEKLDSSYKLWIQIKSMVMEMYPAGLAEWNFPGKKYGWSYRIKDKRRAIIYFLPRDKYFKVAFVFGQKATDKVLESDISEVIKTDLEQARKYTEGRGVSIDIKNDLTISDIRKLIEIKLTH